MAIEETLNTKQQEAVYSNYNRILVIAGAGSGKTKILINRIAYLIDNLRVAPSYILAVTFTNKAALEMKTRLISLNEQGDKTWVGTFHAISHRILRIQAFEAQLDKNFQIIDHQDQRQILTEIIKSLKLDPIKHSTLKLQNYINSQKDNGKRSLDIIPVSADEKIKLEVYKIYERRSDRENLVDFAELILRCVELWSKNVDVLNYWQNRFKYLLIDEFQDSNLIQYQWLKLLCHKESEIMAVGDDDQSIYGWRGAKISNILNFSIDFAPVCEIRLEQNYRSTGNILNAANSLIDNNHKRLGKKLWTKNGSGDHIYLYRAFNEKDEVDFVIKTIKKLKKKDYQYSDIAIFYRSNAQSRIFEEGLLTNKIPYQIYGGMRFYERSEIKNLLGYLKLMLNKDNNQEFIRVINFPPRKIGAKSLEKIKEIAINHNISFYQASRDYIDLFSKQIQSGLNRFFIIMKSAQEFEATNLGEKIKNLMELSGIYNYYQSLTAISERNRIYNLEELINAAYQFSDPLQKDLGLNNFLSSISLDNEKYNDEDYKQKVQIMTIHAAKGLEFAIVFLVGMEEGLLPHQLSIAERETLEEERRLCYVGITRAKEKLYITHALCRNVWANLIKHSPSRFLNEIPQSYLKEIKNFSPNGIYKIRSENSVEYNEIFNRKLDFWTEFRIGVRVYHKDFGVGIITKLAGDRDTKRAQINFEKEGEKWLLFKFANLKTL